MLSSTFEALGGLLGLPPQILRPAAGSKQSGGASCSKSLLSHGRAVFLGEVVLTEPRVAKSYRFVRLLRSTVR